MKPPFAVLVVLMIGLFITPCVSQASTGEAEPGVFTCGLAVVGQTITDPRIADGLGLAANSKMIYLGEGGEANVFKVIFADGSNEVRKYLAEGAKLPLFEMKMLKALEFPGPDSFHIPWVEEVPSRRNVLRMQTLEGEILSDLLFELGKSNPLTSKLITLFNDRRNALKRRAMEIFGGRIQRVGFRLNRELGPSLHELTLTIDLLPEQARFLNDDQVFLSVKPHNVMVNLSNHEMSIVDSN